MVMKMIEFVHDHGSRWITATISELSILSLMVSQILRFLLDCTVKNVSKLTDFTYLVPPSCLCGILALRSHDFWEIWKAIDEYNELFTWLRSHKAFCCENYCWKVRQILGAVLQFFDRVKSVALWSAKKNK